MPPERIVIEKVVVNPKFEEQLFSKVEAPAVSTASKKDWPSPIFERGQMSAFVIPQLAAAAEGKPPAPAEPGQLDISE